MDNKFDNRKFDDIIEGPYTLYGSGVSFNNNKTKDIITNRKIQGTIPLYPNDNTQKTIPPTDFLTPTWTKNLKSANNASSIDYNRWQVFVNGKNNPITAFEFMDNNLR